MIDSKGERYEKIIDGKKYDTETAKLVGSYSADCTARDFYWFEEHLYLKKTGEFFLYGYGNAASEYGGDVIIQPIGIKYAKKWCEKNLSGEEYEELFGEVEE